MSPDALLFVLLAYLSAALLACFSRRLGYALGAAASAAAASLSLYVLLGGGGTELPLQVGVELSLNRFDAYFLLVSSLVWLGTCVYSMDYDDDYPAALSPLFLLTILSMTVILVAGDAVSFLMAWETMTIASFFMILQGRGRREDVRRAAFLFLAFGEASTVLIMVSFAAMYASLGSFQFLGAGVGRVVGAYAPIAFLAALLGFGLKMGLVPFHVSEWLPIAHSNAPSNASAVLSSTLTLMGVYGFMNVMSRLAPYQLWWGWLALSIGGVSALLGASFASTSEHFKGLPAYSTIENNGLILVALGVYLLAARYQLSLMADVALVAAMYHAFSHAVSKASLFSVMGWLSKVRRSFDLNAAARGTAPGPMRATAMAAVLSLAAAPPFAGFVSEWMVLEVLFQSFKFPDVASQLIGTVVGALVALATGIVTVAMTKAYGFGVLLSGKGEGSPALRGSGWYFLSLVTGLGVAAPLVFFLAADAASGVLGGQVFGTFVTGLLGVPAYFVILSGRPFGGFSPTFTAIFMLGMLAVPLAVARVGGAWRPRRVAGWFAGAARPSDEGEMYNSFGYSSPFRIMLRLLFRTRESVLRAGAARATGEYFVDVRIVDVFRRFYDISAKWALALSRETGRYVMPGRMGRYLAYIMLAMMFVLAYILLVAG
ncbi:MAG: hypothetical protein JRN39_02635 [Nitrososphaerota archaeon]|nr:hypothetical protein [Nitrososphaerota archaeon]